MSRGSSPSEPNEFLRLRSLDFDAFFKGAPVDPRAIGLDGQTLVHEAISRRKLDIAVELIRLGAPLDKQDAMGRSALQYAIAYSEWDLAKCLVEAGASPNAADKYGNGPLWAAVVSPKRDERFIAFLVSHGADGTKKNLRGKSALDMCKQLKSKSLWLASGGAEGSYEEV